MTLCCRLCGHKLRKCLGHPPCTLEQTRGSPSYCGTYYAYIWLIFIGFEDPVKDANLLRPLLLEGTWKDCRGAQPIRKTKNEIKIYARFTFINILICLTYRAVYRGRQKVWRPLLRFNYNSIPYELGTWAVKSPWLSETCIAITA